MYAVCRIVLPPACERRSACYADSVKARFVCSSFCVVLLLASCHGRVPGGAGQATVAQQRILLDTQREELERIPPPAKSQYMAIHGFDSWENPYLTVQPGMVELHVMRGDANTTPIGVGGITRPVAARREELNVSLDDLASAISSVPGDAWPYGRVVAIEEAHKTPASAEPTVRRNMETAIARLSDLGIVVYDLSEGKLQ